jgi:PAS domain S-box-containing protein
MGAEASGDGLVLLDGLGRVLSCNPAAEHLLGVPAGTLSGQLLADVPTEFTRADGSELPVIAFKEPQSGAVTGIRNADGVACWVAVSSCPVSAPEGGDGFLLTLRDLSDGLAAEQTLRILSAFVEATDDAVLTLSLDGVVLSWNSGAERMTGWRAETVIGQHLNYFGSDGRETLGLLARAARGQTVRALEARRQRSDGTTFDVSKILSPIYDAQGAIVAVSLIARDIGDRRDLELQLASQVLHDTLTGLPNRALLRDRLAQALAVSERREVPVAVLFLDLDATQRTSARRSGWRSGSPPHCGIRSRLMGGPSRCRPASASP